jgi:ornithine cyclodeaminase
MRHVDDATIEALIDAPSAQAALRDAFASFGAGRAAMQPRLRTESGGVKLSTLGAVLPDQGFAGAKVYTTIEGRFTFVILLFDGRDGRALASFDAGAITRLRTAATSLIASHHLARRDARTLGVFGIGVQGREHVRQFAAAYAIDEIKVHDPFAPAQAAGSLAEEVQRPVRLCSAEEAVNGSDIVVTASRSVSPLFAGTGLAAGSFVAAIGSSLPHTRELDEDALQRASIVAVDWPLQACQETGDLLLADTRNLEGKLVGLADLVTGRSSGRTDAREITVYKSVGVGLQDVAIAALAWQRLDESGRP